MPILPQNAKRYPANWREIRKAILDRAKHRCEWCGVPNYAVGSRDEDGKFKPIRGNIYVDCLGRGKVYPSMQPVTYAEAREFADDSNHWLDDEKLIVIVLTIAHVHDESPENCDPSNLAALCQRCHLTHDAPKKAERRRAKRESGQLSLLD